MISETVSDETWGHISGLFSEPGSHIACSASQLSCSDRRSQDTCKLVLGIIGIHLIIIGRDDGDILYPRVLNGLQKAR